MPIFMCPTEEEWDWAEKNKQTTALTEREEETDGEDVSSYACQSRHQEACCMQHVISANFLELTAPIKLYAISFITTLNTGTEALMLLIWSLIELPP